ncbi:hypothetical protein H7J07_02215 [Mycobacterium koreense]|uniref:Uncharacterized protein n=1 Tax=Mycolicibacillus koreensis TaxID=1069220 RepID=A0A7I7SJ68_9MYCO|nr:hypothetical protein [Mycolicibacillus koreensis]MCV7247074.1 hypothetical protein [Mycolicibacillus koreensis]ODR09902.1 hypothetical protein BHQ15_06415 [Mycolicibacillus koreensis]OSC31898.1 hypothetical protein B8W67_15565 [Mycolicibacillus koreensis]BBY55976.1 hypothetical protein MKOR_32270 [Mycolicibacillus koreensis]
MHEIMVSQVDIDGEVITTAATDPEVMAVSVRTTGEVLDVHLAPGRQGALSVEELREIFVTCAQAAFAQRYDPLIADDADQSV